MIIRLDVFDTTPGATGETAVFAPPASIKTIGQYRQWLWDQRDNHLVRQVMACAARTFTGTSVFPRPAFEGPYAETLEKAIREFHTWSKNLTQPQPAPKVPVETGSAPLDLFQAPDF